MTLKVSDLANHYCIVLRDFIKFTPALHEETSSQISPRWG
ncbi:MAG: hypothetical protein ACI97P_002317 [Arcticibacterium sp.]|jgi:hypothetical protein